jgi:hypothetical protein
MRNEKLYWMLTSLDAVVVWSFNAASYEATLMTPGIK